MALSVWNVIGGYISFVHYCNVLSGDIVFICSDERKWRTFVSGEFQEIDRPSCLLWKPAENLIVSSQWRSSNILIAAGMMKFKFVQILFQCNRKLANFLHGNFSYSIDNIGHCRWQYSVKYFERE